MSSGAFSGKKKAALLKAKRKTQRERQERDADEDAAQASRATARGADGKPRLKTVLQREDEQEVQQGRADATRPVELTPAAQQALLLPWPAELQPPISMPVRPQWAYEDGPEALDAREVAAFAAWTTQLHATHARESLSRYERNLEVWRQLWRTSEVSDALLLVVDIRTPLLSFPAPLYEYEAARGTPMVVVLNKADLLPPAVVTAWAAHLQHRFPRLTAVVPFRADPGAAPKGFKGGSGSRKTGFNRWRGGDEAVRDDVEALMKAIKALPVTRDGVARTFGDFWGSPDAVAAQAASAAVADDEARAAAALELSAGWASQQLTADDSATRHADAARALRRYVTLGVVGEPNMGKSAVINRLFRAPVVKARIRAPPRVQ
jgi:ribosome biogenesis GTPase A